MKIGRICGLAMLAGVLWAQAPNHQQVVVEQPDAQRVHDELSNLLDRYPPALRNVLKLDNGLLSNPAYLAPYPGLASFLNAHPEIARNPTFYIGLPEEHRRADHSELVLETWKDVLAGLAAFLGFASALLLAAFLIKTVVDYRRWNRLSKVQTEVHTKLLDRFSANNDLLAYIQSPAGAKFLESTPIRLDAGPRSLSAPLARILWSIQGGVVLLAGGIGMLVVSEKVSEDAYQALHALGILGIALGLGFVVSAGISFAISHRLGLMERAVARESE